MWATRPGRAAEVSCIACGEEVARRDAREYDKYGDRFDRAEKRFEHLCKGCYREQSHQPRDGLERLLVASEAGEAGRREFLERYTALVTAEWDQTRAGPGREASED
jgi:hypothetical protein